ncbi:MAG TPA: DUF481 domain-containing protein [Blastocatellia bacterium]|nr:DUF481 domain-containing protein [Blastocatellia bacterium]
MLKTFLFALIAGVILSMTVLADQITLKNGDRLSGKIVRTDGKTLTIKTDLAGLVTVPWDAIEGITSDQPLHLMLKDGQTVVGTVAGTEGKFEIRTADAGTVTVSKDAVRLLRSGEDQAAYQAEADRLRNPRLLDLWSGAVDAGLSLTRGNADTATFTLGMNAARTTPRDRIGIYATALYAKNNVSGESLTTANAIRGGVRYDFNLTNRTFAFGFGDLEFDEFQKLDLRMVLGGGLGFHALKKERTVLDLFGGGSLNKEYFSTGLKRTSGEVLAGEELTHRLSDRVLLKQRAVFFPNLTETGEYRLTFDASAVTSLSKLLGWHVTFSDRYLSNPVLGARKNDLLLTTGIRLTFAK